jgi:hypothetical protein
MSNDPTALQSLASKSAPPSPVPKPPRDTIMPDFYMDRVNKLYTALESKEEKTLEEEAFSYILYYQMVKTTKDEKLSTFLEELSTSLSQQATMLKDLTSSLHGVSTDVNELLTWKQQKDLTDQDQTTQINHIQTSVTNVQQEVEQTHADFANTMTEINNSLTVKITDAYDTFSEKITSVKTTLDEEIKAVKKDLSEFKTEIVNKERFSWEKFFKFAAGIVLVGGLLVTVNESRMRNMFITKESLNTKIVETKTTADANASSLKVELSTRLDNLEKKLDKRDEADEAQQKMLTELMIEVKSMNHNLNPTRINTLNTNRKTK